MLIIKAYLIKAILFYKKNISLQKGYSCYCHTHLKESSCSDNALYLLSKNSLLCALRLIWQRSRRCRKLSKQNGFGLKIIFSKHGMLAVGLSILTGCGGGSSSDSSSSSNAPPTANAGADQIVMINGKTTITLDGSASYDKNGQITRYSWRDVSGKSISYRLSSYDTAKPTLTIPDMAAEEILEFELTVINSQGKSARDTIKITIKPPENRKDYTISFSCDQTAKHYASSQAMSMDIDFVDDGFNLLDKLYDDRTPAYSYQTIPLESTFKIDNLNEDENKYGYYDNSIKHHNLFKQNLDNNLIIKCNYSSGQANLVFPIKEMNEWNATRVSTYKQDIRNDLYFYISSLSDLHSKVYLKEFNKSRDSINAYYKANNFMNKAFPGSHYTAETASKYYTDAFDLSYKIEENFNKDNKIHYSLLDQLANEITSGSVNALLNNIANNYESYYLSNDKKCIDKTICGALFPEYASSVTLNNSFDGGLQGWKTQTQVSSYSSGEIIFLQNTKVASLTLSGNTPAYSTTNTSTLRLYQDIELNGGNIDDYFLHFDLSHVYGGAEGGFAAAMGVNSTGVAGAFICFNDINEVSIGCLAWTDHTNKFDLAWSGRNGFDSTDIFYNTRLSNVIKRMEPAAEQFVYKIDIGEFTKNHLPVVYNQKHKISKIEYGIYTSEHKSSDGSCYFCMAKIKAKKIDLLKKN